jgi:hypothetical protein
VPDVAQMWRNTHALLREGGVALAFFPTLYAPAFWLNSLLPERLSRSVLLRFFPNRQAEGDNPKFPALYDHCFSAEDRLGPLLRGIGFREVTIFPFYGYSYFDGIWGLRQLDHAFTRLCARRDWRTFSSYAYVVAVK